MRCFESLVRSHFLGNVSTELSLARQAIKSHTTQTPSLYFRLQDRKQIYDEFVYQNYILEDMRDALREESEKNILFYLQTDEHIYIYSRCKQQVDDAIRYSYNVNGDLPFHRTKHKILKKTVHAVLIDTRIQFNPISPN